MGKKRCVAGFELPRGYRGMLTQIKFFPNWKRADRQNLYGLKFQIANDTAVDGSSSLHDDDSQSLGWQTVYEIPYSHYGVAAGWNTIDYEQFTDNTHFKDRKGAFIGRRFRIWQHAEWGCPINELRFNGFVDGGRRRGRPAGEFGEWGSGELGRWGRGRWELSGRFRKREASRSKRQRPEQAPHREIIWRPFSVHRALRRRPRSTRLDGVALAGNPGGDYTQLNSMFTNQSPMSRTVSNGFRNSRTTARRRGSLPSRLCAVRFLARFAE